jgi:pimeloyl-ACP methyl ester carboxylesterase
MRLFKGMPERNKTPILMLHGICHGLGYMCDIVEAFQDRLIIYLDINCIRFNWITLDVPDPNSLKEIITQILKQYGIPKVSIISHSWGTFLAGWIIKLMPEVVSQITLIDPISITVELPETTYCILYKYPDSIPNLLLYLFIRNDLTISNNLHRHFAWYNMALKFQEIPDHIPVVVSIAGKDELIDSKTASELTTLAIQAREKSSGASITHLVWDDFIHGMALHNSESVLKIKQSIQNNEVVQENNY